MIAEYTGTSPREATASEWPNIQVYLKWWTSTC